MRDTKQIIEFLKERKTKCLSKIEVEDVRPKMNETEYFLAQLDLCEELLHRISYEELEEVN